jgi:hypothetical protein
MGNRADATTQVVDTKQPEPTLEAKVNDIVGRMTKDEKGSWVVPDEVQDEAVRFAAMAERRRRDTQADYTKVTQKAKALEAEKATLLQKIVDGPDLDLSPEKKEALEQLKFEDPEEWRKQVNILEKETKQKRKLALDEELGKATASTLETEELERRANVLAEFNASHEGFTIDDDVIANDIPPRIIKKLETGKITFEDFLQECYDYSTTGKVVKQETTMDQPNLSKVPGGSKPDNKAVKEDVITSYRKETY